jgi:DNA-directed RNA polymerase subunit F
MIVKAILKEEILTLAEVKELFDQIKQKRSEEDELGYELRRAMRHAELFSHGNPDKSRHLAEELLKLEKMTAEIAGKIVDIKPANRNELRAIYAKERFTLSEEELDKILDIVFRG